MAWIVSSLRAFSSEKRACWHGYFFGYGQQD